MLSHHWHASETPGGPMMADLLWYLDPLSPHQLKKTSNFCMRVWASLESSLCIMAISIKISYGIVITYLGPFLHGPTFNDSIQLEFS